METPRDGQLDARWRLWGWTVAICLVAGLTGGLVGRVLQPNLAGRAPAVTPELRVQRLLLVDAQGRVRGGLRLLEDGSPALLLGGRDQEAGALVSLRPAAGGAVVLTDARGRMRLAVGPLDDGRWGVAVYDERAHVTARTP